MMYCVVAFFSFFFLFRIDVYFVDLILIMCVLAAIVSIYEYVCIYIKWSADATGCLNIILAILKCYCPRAKKYERSVALCCIDTTCILGILKWPRHIWYCTWRLGNCDYTTFQAFRCHCTDTFCIALYTFNVSGDGWDRTWDFWIWGWFVRPLLASIKTANHCSLLPCP
jgi:hypothetical protein